MNVPIDFIIMSIISIIFLFGFAINLFLKGNIGDKKVMIIGGVIGTAVYWIIRYLVY